MAANQIDRADNVHVGTNTEVVQKLRQQMREFKETVDKVIVLWSANTEMFYLPEIHTADALEKKIRQDEPLPSSVLYAFAAVKEGIIYLNGSPQNTLHPGVIELAAMEGTFVVAVTLSLDRRSSRRS